MNTHNHPSIRLDFGFSMTIFQKLDGLIGMFAKYFADGLNAYFRMGLWIICHRYNFFL
ncbi:hypothetical protein THICB1_150089 [Thiomonas arsenitoxydans]|uniref:Uncharacterized protein n=1 Tax=Thiomonas arsenitoxydans (strain DSM 22701 / CIP 110005 / 3As) TaxID=426114 RepID=A0ABP1Z146_THIA3|nr:hypothetical protein THICB1_150089 [Thiomonas arsenitoxydans]CQR35515.1 hypothetical protein THICB6_230024 [Thiomonas arsenitoxydans]